MKNREVSVKLIQARELLFAQERGACEKKYLKVRKM